MNAWLRKRFWWNWKSHQSKYQMCHHYRSVWTDWTTWCRGHRFRSWARPRLMSQGCPSTGPWRYARFQVQLEPHISNSLRTGLRSERKKNPRTSVATHAKWRITCGKSDLSSIASSCCLPRLQLTAAASPSGEVLAKKVVKSNHVKWPIVCRDGRPSPPAAEWADQ